MAQAAQQARVAAAASLKDSIREMRRYMGGANPSKRLLQNKLNKVNENKDELVKIHYVYADKANIDLESDDALNWITPKLDDANDIADEVILMIDEIETIALQQQQTVIERAEATDKTNEILVAEMQYQADEKALRNRIESMMEIANNPDNTSKDDANMLRTYLRQVEESMDDQIKSWNSCKALVLPQEKLQAIFTNEENLKKHVSDSCLIATTFLNKIDPETVVPRAESTTGSDSVVNEKFMSAVKGEKIQNPVFDGDIRSFARFKTDFENIVVTNHSNNVTYQTYVLKKSCLTGDAKKLVENMTDLNEIWKRLQARYGQDMEVVHAVLKEIQDFQFNKSDHDRSLVKLVDKLEKGVDDLSAINSKNDIANALTVKLIEEKLPRQVQQRWIQQEAPSDSNSTSSDRFDKMMDFLKLERTQAERLLLLNPKRETKDGKKPQPHLAAGAGGEQRTPNEKKCIVHPNAVTHFTRKCKTFRSKSVQERGQIVKDANACKFCLGTSHIGEENCPFEATWQKCDIDGCDQPHSRLLHGCTIRGIGCFAEICNTNIPSNQTLLLIQYVKAAHVINNTTFVSKAVTFWDGGSTITLVARDYARRNNLQGVPITYDLITVGGKVTTHNTMLYEITIISTKREPHIIAAFEIEEICGTLAPIDTKRFAKFFPRTKPSQISRPSGSIDLLIGNNNAPLHPDKKHVHQGLVLYESQFGTGRILGGSHSDIDEITNISAHVHRCAKARVTNVHIRRENPALDFITTEAFGTEPLRCCNNCQNCKECKFAAQQLSRENQADLQIIKNNLSLDPIKQQWTATYACKQDPSVLKNNKSQAKVLAERTEKRLLKDKPTLNKYNEQFRLLITSEVLDEISEEEEESYDGPIYYVSHHDVRKPGSSSTPLRLVINSSLRFHGIGPNDVWIKGPNALNDMFEILLRFREHKFALIGDIKKMYTQIHTTPKEKHMRRILWRFGKSDEEFKTFGVNRVMFGDRPAAAISSIAIRETAEIYKSINEEAAQKIQDDTYVDDITTGADTMEDVTILKEDIAKILQKGGLEVKGFVVSGDDSEEALALLGSGDIKRVLGTSYDPTSDEISVTVSINVSKKYRGARTEPDYTYEEIPKLISIVLTRRILQGIVYSCYDVFGLVSPITIQLKIELRNLFTKELNLGWDDPVPDEVKRKWIVILQKVKSVEHVRFRRCIKPKEPVVGKPDLIICNDASRDAMCATAHVRWELENGDIQCSLYVAKTRVAPLQKETIPRLEMQSAVLGARLGNKITNSATLEFNEVIHVLDSTCTLATLHKDTIALKEFMGNRTAEILKKSKLENWYHVDTKKNISDLGTRKNATVEDVSEGSEWQLGADWMRLPKKEWPLSQDFSGHEVPPEELVNKCVIAFASSIDNIINIYDVERFRGRSYTFLLNVTARVMNICSKRSFKHASDTLTPVNIINAEKICIQASMFYTKQEFLAGKLKSLRAQVDDEGIICVNSRANDAMIAHYGCDKFPILAYKDPLAYIWLQHIHNEDHTGVTTTVAKSRRKFWVVRARKLAEKIKNNCYLCRLIDKKLAEQLMAPLPTSRFKVTPSFYVTAMDLFGPLEIIDTVKQRSRKKVWGAIFNCTVTRAVHIDLTEDYSTDSILETIRRFLDIRGTPAEIQSDQGSQLIAAAKDIAHLVEKWDWKPIAEYTALRKVKWTLAPAEGQHQNGVTESLVKITKRSIKHQLMGKKVLTFSQLQTVFFEIANIMNCRPLGLKEGSDPENPIPITPNSLLTGNTTNEAPQGPFDMEGSKSITKRFRYMQEMVTQWWDEWYRTVFPSLVPCYKWLQRHRNVKVGDVCLIRYRKETRCTYRLGRVREVRTGTDGLVRTVKLEYKLPNEKVFRAVDRPVQGISVIVPIEEQESQIMGTAKAHALNPCAAAFESRIDCECNGQ